MKKVHPHEFHGIIFIIIILVLKLRVLIIKKQINLKWFQDFNCYQNANFIVKVKHLF